MPSNKNKKKKVQPNKPLYSNSSISSYRSNDVESEGGPEKDESFSMIDEQRLNVELGRTRQNFASPGDELDDNSSAHAADADSRNRTESQGDSSQFNLSDWHESAITSTYCESDFGDGSGDFTAEQLLHYLELRHNRSSSTAYNELTTKDEILQIKSQRIFLFCHLMGHFCRVKMLPSYERPGATYPKNTKQQVCFDGIYISLSFNSGEYLLEQVEEILVDSTTGKEECVSIFTDRPINIRMENVEIIEFRGLNITFNGCEALKHKIELPKGCRPAQKQQEVTNEIKEEKQKEVKKVENPTNVVKEQAAKPAIWADFKLEPKNKPVVSDPKKSKENPEKTAPKRKDKQDNIQQTKKPEQQTRSPEVKPLDSVPIRPKNMTASKLNNTDGKSRELIRYSTETQSEKNQELLEDSMESPAPFDQFKDRKTDYQFEKYSTQIEKTNVTQEMEIKATRLEIALRDTCDLQEAVEVQGNEELTHSSVVRNNKKKTRLLRVKPDQTTNEQELTSYTDIQRQTSESISPESNLTSDQILKNKLRGALGPLAGNNLNPREQQSPDILKPLENISRKPSDARSRTSSLRNGEASRVMDQLNLEGPNIQKDDYDEYQEFLLNEKQIDRKASQDFFQAESARMQEQIDNMAKARRLKEEAQQKSTFAYSKPKVNKKFSCFNQELDSDRQLLDCFQDRNMQPRPGIKSLLSLFK